MHILNVSIRNLVIQTCKITLIASRTKASLFFYYAIFAESLLQ